ncbi:uncharacterized protein DS421_17g601300 [Arachis hypogaea]|nr:uncharacterized protein DS421_17g601300 [Arachis hypogaea]
MFFISDRFIILFHIVFNELPTRWFLPINFIFLLWLQPKGNIGPNQRESRIAATLNNVRQTIP